MPYTPITPLPAVPNRSDAPDTFSDDVDSFLSALPTLQEQINNSGAYIDAVGIAVDADAAAAGLSETNAASSAIAAAASATAASYKGLWSAQTGAANKPYSVYHAGAYWALNNNLANVATSTPSLTNADWQFIGGTTWQPVASASFSLAPNGSYDILATGSAVNAALTAMVDTNFVIVRNSFSSTQTVTITNSIFTIYCKNGVVINSRDTLVVKPGAIVRFKARSGTILEQF